jgi:hypothetical protein
VAPAIGFSASSGAKPGARTARRTELFVWGCSAKRPSRSVVVSTRRIHGRSAGISSSAISSGPPAAPAYTVAPATGCDSASTTRPRMPATSADAVDADAAAGVTCARSFVAALASGGASSAAVPRGRSAADPLVPEGSVTGLDPGSPRTRKSTPASTPARTTIRSSTWMGRMEDRLASVVRA